MAALTDADKVLRNDTGKDIVTKLEAIKNTIAAGGSSTLAGLTDVNLSTPTDGQVLKYDATNDEWINDDESGGSMISTASGSIASFNNGGDDIPVKSLVTDIVAVQSGSGTPSPSNVRPITGFDSIVIKVDDGDNVTQATQTISLPETIYGGSLDVTNGNGNKTWAIINLSTVTWGKRSDAPAGANIFRTNNINTRRIGTDEDGIFGICTSYEFYRNAIQSSLLSGLSDGQFGYLTANQGIFFRNDSCSTVEEFIESLAGVYLIYELATPTTFNVTPTEVKTLSGTNNIYADTGDIEVEYFNSNANETKELHESLGGGNANIWEGTKAEYDALATKDPDTVYFLKDVNGDGSQFQPVIYSLEEREIGVWTDGKPLYEKTIVFSSEITLDTSNWTSLGVSLSDVDTPVSAIGRSARGGNSAITVDFFDSPITAKGLDKVKSITMQYTKTTDVAGSGTWTPQGVPAVHYSTDEQVVGTWIDGSTLYEKTLSFTAPNSNAYSSVSLGVDVDYISIVEAVAIGTSQVGYLNGAYTGSPVNDEWQGFINLSNLSFDYRVGTIYRNAECFVTIRYTKTS